MPHERKHRVLVALGAAVVGGVAIAASGNAALLQRRRRHRADRHALGERDPDDGDPARGVAAHHRRRVGARRAARSAGSAAAHCSCSGCCSLASPIVVVPIAPSVFALLPSHRRRAQPALPAGAAEAASAAHGGAQAADVRRVAHVADPDQPDRGGGQRRDGAADRVHVLLALAIARSPPATREPLAGFFQALGDAMLVLVRWVVRGADRRLRAGAAARGARGGAASRARSASTSWRTRSACIAVTLLLYTRWSRSSRAIPMRQFARAALPAQLIAFSSSSSIASLPALVESAERGLELPNRRHRVRAAARGLDVQDRGAGVVDGRRAVRRVVLRHSAPRAASWRPSRSRRCSSRSRRPAFRAARSSCWRRSSSRSGCRSKGSAS